MFYRPMEGRDALLSAHDIITQTKILNGYDVIVPALECGAIPSPHLTLAWEVGGWGLGVCL